MMRTRVRLLCLLALSLSGCSFSKSSPPLSTQPEPVTAPSSTSAPNLEPSETATNPQPSPIPSIETLESLSNDLYSGKTNKGDWLEKSRTFSPQEVDAAAVLLLNQALVEMKNFPYRYVNKLKPMAELVVTRLTLSRTDVGAGTMDALRNILLESWTLKHKLSLDLHLQLIQAFLTHASAPSTESAANSIVLYVIAEPRKKAERQKIKTWIEGLPQKTRDLVSELMLISLKNEKAEMKSYSSESGLTSLTETLHLWDESIQIRAADELSTWFSNRSCVGPSDLSSDDLLPTAVRKLGINAAVLLPYLAKCTREAMKGVHIYPSDQETIARLTDLAYKISPHADETLEMIAQVLHDRDNILAGGHYSPKPELPFKDIQEFSAIMDAQMVTGLMKALESSVYQWIASGERTSVSDVVITKTVVKLFEKRPDLLNLNQREILKNLSIEFYHSIDNRSHGGPQWIPLLKSIEGSEQVFEILMNRIRQTQKDARNSLWLMGMHGRDSEAVCLFILEMARTSPNMEVRVSALSQSRLLSDQYASRFAASFMDISERDLKPNTARTILMGMISLIEFRRTGLTQDDAKPLLLAALRLAIKADEGYSKADQERLMGDTFRTQFFTREMLVEIRDTHTDEKIRALAAKYISE